MDENPNDSGENNPGAEPIVAPDEINNEEKPETEMPEAASISDSEPEPGSMEPEMSEPKHIDVSEPEAEPESTPEPVSEPAPIPTPEPMPTPEPAPVPMQPMMDPAMKKKGHGGLIFLAIIAILLVIAGVVICVILLNASSEKPNTSDKPKEQPTPVVEELATVTCEASGDAWNYTASIAIEENKLEAKQISAELKLLDGYNAESLTETEKKLLGDFEDALSNYDADADGVTVVSEGSFEAGAGYMVSVKVDREKVTDEEILKNFEDNLDGITAEDYAESTSGENSDGIMVVCTVE